MQATLCFPPLISGLSTGQPAFAVAQAQAKAGTDAGLLVYNIGDTHLTAAIVLAPEVPLAAAMAMVPAVANGFADAFGTRAPSEVALQFVWPGQILINGALCGGLRAAASSHDPQRIPDWLVIGLDLALRPAHQDPEPGETPMTTTLWAEGCAEITAESMLESWARHMLLWIHTWLDQGIRPLHAHWRQLLIWPETETTITLPRMRQKGRLIGLDEACGLLMQSGGQTHLLPLVDMLEEI